MIIESIGLQNFLSHENSTVTFTDAPLWLISGENGSGKSALFDGVEFALYGSHRGGSQGAKYLVKQGTRRAMAQVVIVLDGQRLRVTQHIDADSGNRGGQIERWDEAGRWTPINVGDGRDAVWKWLEPRLPKEELFLSAIFLRQGETARFLHGSSGDRIKKFAELVDLSRYSELSRRAQQKGAVARRRQSDAEAKLEELGDTSGEAVQALERQIKAAKLALDAAKERAKEASIVVRGAREWERLHLDRERLENRRGDLSTLLEHEATIREDARLVSNWDRVAVRLERYWNFRGQAEQGWEEAKVADEKAAKADVTCRQREAELDRAQHIQHALLNKSIPATKNRATLARNQAQGLRLETQIAEKKAALATQDEEIRRLAGKDEELLAWQKRKAAIPRLENMAESRDWVASVAASFGLAQRSLATAQIRVAKAERGLDTRKIAEEQAQAAVEAKEGEISRITQDAALLEGRIQSHDRLTGIESECPVCGQALNEAAHVHVQLMLADEQGQLAQSKADLATARRVLEQLRDTRDRTQRWFRRGERTVQRARERVALAEQDLERSEDGVRQADQKLARARQQVLEHHPEYETTLDDISLDWVGAEKLAVSAAVERLEPEERVLAETRQRQRATTVALDTLRGQRAAGALPRGEEENSEPLACQAGSLEQEAATWEERTDQLEKKEKRLQEGIRALSSEVAKLTEQVRSERARAEKSQEEAREADAKAEAVAQELGADWIPVLDNHETFAAVQKDIGGRGASAQKLPDLLQASGQLREVEADLEDNTMAMGKVAQAHRIPLADAQDNEMEAQAEAQKANEAKLLAEQAQGDLEVRREKATGFQKEINEASLDARTFDELAVLLKEGGPIQTEVAECEQHRIANEVNQVLQRLSDPLQVVLGEARRSRGIELQDLLIIDTGDPVGKPRFFEFLSGGEQFRVALALALALHRRVGGKAGTIIVDEGFGALDEGRRDALALQMTDTSEGILQLGLAESIIICSHSAVVQRHFPYRWLIQKQGGTAAVLRPDLE